ncbi:MAG TPA: alpha/beta hydrolase [Gammaproteobacteria bacterium]|jgi:acetyl esterase/lipase|nr:alpha/beta hydrolase [Gammaproteobacteria bacterium]
MDTQTQNVFEHLRALANKAVALLDDLPARRALIDTYFQVDGQAASVIGSVQPDVCGDIPLEWVCAPGVDTVRRTLYIHGGSWVSGSLAGYRALASRVSEATGTAVLLVDYKLAPEHPFPSGLMDCTMAFQWMRENGPDGASLASQSLIMGDSAGGNLTLAAFLALQDADGPVPDGLVALSPATDFTGGSPSLQTHAERDPVIHPLVYKALAPLYLGGKEPRHPWASPLFGDFTQAPPVLLQVGSEEVLLDDSTRLAEHIEQQGGRVELHVWDDMPHVFQGFAPALTQANSAISQIGAFVKGL